MPSSLINDLTFQVTPIGRIVSPIRDRISAPKQGYEGSPVAWLHLSESMRPALADLQPGDEIIVLTWLDRSDRSVLSVHPRGDRTKPLKGVFSTRSPSRPNPIGLHRVRIRAIVDTVRLEVDNLEAFDGTPIIDIKPVLTDVADA
ncbi:S-adenosyl-L-methionine-binding protein [mine drainage metagenome]|uniref:S-adenosyl-L-methionine-binding protein n=1 Tax=mine drainage metagenome TaxID=410659 RepID=A0A1J5RAD3_9ZZZZ